MNWKEPILWEVKSLKKMVDVLEMEVSSMRGL